MSEKMKQGKIANAFRHERSGLTFVCCYGGWRLDSESGTPEARKALLESADRFAKSWGKPVSRFTFNDFAVVLKYLSDTKSELLESKKV